MAWAWSRMLGTAVGSAVGSVFVGSGVHDGAVVAGCVGGKHGVGTVGGLGVTPGDVGAGQVGIVGALGVTPGDVGDDGQVGAQKRDPGKTRNIAKAPSRTREIERILKTPFLLAGLAQYVIAYAVSKTK